MAHYENAVEVKGNKRGKLRRRRSPAQEIPRISLVYLDSSPDYCIRNKRTGVLGTKGRQCRKGAPGSEGCGLMCCGRGYRTYKVKIREKCNCKFVWCCSVECQSCERTVRRQICKWDYHHEMMLLSHGLSMKKFAVDVAQCTSFGRCNKETEGEFIRHQTIQAKTFLPHKF